MYQIEIIVFARDTAEAEAEEHWHNDYSLHYPDKLTVLQPAAEGAAGQMQLLPTLALQLKREASILAQRRTTRVLFHGAWQQYLDEAGRTGSVFIGGGQQFGEHQELEGFVTFSVAHFLHIDTNLWLSRFSRAEGAATTDAPVLPKSPLARNFDAGTTPAAYNVSEIYVLKEAKNMRSGELHYQDHPRLGVLVLVTPVQAAPQ
jgi:hypothetical protein